MIFFGDAFHKETYRFNENKSGMQFAVFPVVPYRESLKIAISRDNIESTMF